ncbi:MAG TPA: hypothetical protein VH835_13025 [Dongiaceae bacterium]|jgi:hypothetical protein
MFFRSRKWLFVSAVSLLALAGCANDHSMHSSSMSQSDSGGMQMAAADGPAADLRSALDQLLGEHVQLAADATNAALNGREGEFQAAAASLDANSVDISNAIGSIYGKDAGDAFLGLWRSHITMVVDYTVGTASKDKAKQDQAVGELIQYTQDFGAFLNSANPNLPQEAVAELVKHHAITLKEVIDAQGAGDQARAYTALREAYSHMATIAEALANGIVKQFPEKFA